MIFFIKAALLFFSLIVVIPIVFFLLIGYVGNIFSTNINRNSWISRYTRK